MQGAFFVVFFGAGKLRILGAMGCHDHHHDSARFVF